MKVFISHQRADSEKALEISRQLELVHKIPTYVDLIDTRLGKSGVDLAQYLQSVLSKCTHLIAVTSYNTKFSQWVPWEIGVATEKNYPLATFAGYSDSVPEFLASWPYLRTILDVDKYANAAKSADNTYRIRRAIATESLAKNESVNSFFTMLRRDLGQPI